MQQVTDILNQIAPFIVYVVYAGGALLVLAVLALLLRLLSGTCVGLLKFSGRLLILLGILLLLHQLAAMVAGASSAESFTYYGYPLWLIAIAMLVAGIPFRLLGALKPTRY